MDSDLTDEITRETLVIHKGRSSTSASRAWCWRARNDGQELAQLGRAEIT